MRHILKSVEVLILCGNLDSATPAACAKEIQTCRIGNRSSVDIELIIVKTLVLRSAFAGPDTFFVLNQVVFNSSNIELNLVCLGCENADPNPAFRIYLRILLTLLRRSCRLEILY